MEGAAFLFKIVPLNKMENTIQIKEKLLITKKEINQ